MDVKGSALLSVPAFVRAKFPDRFDEWMRSLSPGAREIMERPLPSAWYPLQAGMIEPCQRACDLFFSGSDRGAWEMGRFGAGIVLTGIYRIFVQLGSPAFLIGKAAHIFQNYFRDAELKVVENVPDHARVQITRFAEPHRIVEGRVAGWMEAGLEISGCQDIQLGITQSMAKGDPITEFVAAWK